MKVENRNKEKKHIKGLSFLSLGLYAFLGLGLEVLLAFVIEPLLYRKGLDEFGTLENILHWILTCIMWGVTALILISVSKKKYEFNIFTYRDKLGIINWIVAFILLAISIIISVWDWNGLKVLKEFEYNGWLKFIFQYMYYLFETVLVVLIIIFGQRAGEVWFKSSKIPWGGFLVGLTWGLVHMLTKGDLLIGLLSCFGGVLYGILYLTVKKNVYIAYPLIFLMFVL